MKKLLTIISIISVVLLTGCTVEEGKPSAQDKGQKQTEKAFTQQSSAVEYPVDLLKDSLERRNLRERLLRTNKPSAISYLYVFSFGKPIGYYTVKGKVSSTQSQMTTDQLITCRKDKYGDCMGYEGDEYHVVNAPGDDGSYGANEAGVFFFTTEGAMVTTSLDYIVSDQPINISATKLNKE